MQAAELLKSSCPQSAILITVLTSMVRLEVFAGLSSTKSVRDKVLFLWVCQSSQLFRISPYVLRETSCYLGLCAFLPAILGSHLLLFDLANETVQKEELPFAFSQGTRFCQLDAVTVVGVGGSAGQSEVWAVSLQTCATWRLPDLVCGRGSAGVIHCRNAVYVFGGTVRGQALRSCEVLHAQKWESLPNMQQPHSHFSPCVHETSIYLPDVSCNSLMEVFFPDQMTFILMNWRLPCILSPSVAFMTKGQLVVVTCARKLITCDLHSSVTVSSTQTNETLSGTSSFQPLSFQHKVYWVRLGSLAVVGYDESTNRVFEYKTIEK